MKGHLLKVILVLGLISCVLCSTSALRTKFELRALHQGPAPNTSDCPVCNCDPTPPIAPPQINFQGNSTSSNATLTPQERQSIMDLCSGMALPPGNCSRPEEVCSWNISAQFQAKCTSTSKKRAVTTLISLEITDSVFNSTLDFLGGLNNLEFFSFIRTSVSGTIPSNVFQGLTSLKQFILTENLLLTGDLPTELGLLPNLISLQIQSSPISGTIPNQIGQLTNLVALSLSGSFLNGTIPSSLATLPLLEYVDLSRNQLTGPLPAFSQQSLLTLNLQENFLSGSIPSSFETLRLNQISLSRNILSGGLSHLFLLNNLTSLYLSTNTFVGVIPTISTFSRLQILDLSSNRVSGSIPKGIFDITTLTTLNLASNQLRGPIPSSIQQLQNLQSLSLGLNSFNGTFPSEIGFLTKLNRLDLRSNLLSGVLPSTLSSLTMLQFLYLEKNQMNGGKFTFGSTNFVDCRLGTMKFNCDYDAPFTCFHSRCYSEYNPCLQNQDLVDCISPAFCVPLIDDLWYTCQCPSDLAPLDQYSCVDYPPLSAGAAVGIAIGAAFGIFLLLVIAAVIFFFFRARIDLSSLPSQVRAPYALFTAASAPNWDTVEVSGVTYYALPLKPGTEAYDQMKDLFDQLGGQLLPIKTASIIYNKTTIQNFINARKLLSARMESNASLFSNQTWRNEQNPLRDWVYSQYERTVNRFSWNKDQVVPIIPSVHGTELRFARFICATGFANLSLTDAGFYGKGIYFTTFAMYSSPYFVSRKQPVILISWLILGNTFPVIEHHKKDGSLMGKAIQRGYNSHFVVTKRDGSVPDERITDPFDEIVIPQENQISPVYLLELDPTPGVVMKIVQQWVKDESKAKEQASNKKAPDVIDLSARRDSKKLRASIVEKPSEAPSSTSKRSDKPKREGR